MERYILIDPIGINLQAFPVSEPIVLEAGSNLYNARTANGGSITGAAEFRMDFAFSCDMNKPDADKLWALARKQETEGRQTEIVIYYAWDTITDMGSQSRQNIPGIDPVVLDGTTTYYPVAQGDIVVTRTLIGQSGETTRYRCDVEFIEGTIRRP